MSTEFEIDFGPCCACGRPGTRHLLMLKFAAPVPGAGWGCYQCGRPMDGAVAALCDDCMEGEQELKWVLRGSDGRMDYKEAARAPAFNHDLSKHPETWVCERCGCTQERACEGGCYWVKQNVCSDCATFPEISDFIKAGGQPVIPREGK